MIGRACSLVGQVFESGLSLAEVVLDVAHALLTQSPRGRRLVLAANLLRGNPTMYGVDLRDGVPAPHGLLMVADSTSTVSVPQIVVNPAVK